MIKIVPRAHARHPDLKTILNRNPAPSEEIRQVVHGILQDVQTRGMKAVLEYAREFDGLKGSLLCSTAEIKKAAANVSPALGRDLKAAIRNIRNFHKNQLESSWMVKGKDGVKLGQKIRGLHRVGVYVPGGSGKYPSTLMMNAIPAQVAGVKEIVAVTPVGKTLNPSIAFCLLELGITEVYKIGGAQSIGLLAYGAGKVRPVDKIVGPANVYASLAKKEVFGTVDIDMIAGPSEILVLADETADPDWVAADLLSQAEHGSGWEAAVCITDSIEQAKLIKECLEVQVESSPKSDILQTALARYGRIYVVQDMDEAVIMANLMAPEHLEVLTRNAEKIADQIENAGAIFIGPWSSEPIGDYFAGPNHVLPTNGTARFASPLGVYDFIKRTSIIHYSKEAAQKSALRIGRIADEEGFFHHAAAVRKRL